MSQVHTQLLTDDASGALVEDSVQASLTSSDGRTSFNGQAAAHFADGAQSIALKGTFVLNGSPFSLDQTIACKQLFSDL